MPRRPHSACMPGSAMMARNSPLSLSTTGFGVPAGATTIHHDEPSKPGKPASPSGGMSGAEPTRCAVETPSARSLPSRTSGSAEEKSPNTADT